MAAITICSDFGAPKNKVWHCFHCFPIYLPWRGGTMILVFWMLSFKPTFSLSTFTFIKRLFSSAIRVVSSAYLRWLIFLPAILLPACVSSSTNPQINYHYAYWVWEQRYRNRKGPTYNYFQWLTLRNYAFCACSSGAQSRKFFLKGIQ